MTELAVGNFDSDNDRRGLSSDWLPLPIRLRETEVLACTGDEEHTLDAACSLPRLRSRHGSSLRGVSHSRVSAIRLFHNGHGNEMRIRASRVLDPNSTWPGVLDMLPRASVHWDDEATMIRQTALRKQYALS